MANDLIINNNSDPWNHFGSIIGIPSRRRIICGIVLIVFVLILIVIAFAIMSKQDNSKNIKQIYASFHSTLNISVDPCMDFYNFSCGLWTTNNSISYSTSRVTTFSILQDSVNKKLRKIFEYTKIDNNMPRIVNDAVRFYNECTQQNISNDGNMQLLLDYFDHFGGWPILNKYKWNESAFDWVHTSAFLIKYLDLHAVIGVYTFNSEKERGGNIIYLKPPTILQDENGMLSNVLSSHMLYLILSSLNNSNIYSDVIDDIGNLKVVESKWHELLYVSPKISEPLFMSINKLNQQMPQIDWLNYLQLITNDTLLETNKTLTINDTVAIHDFDFLKKIVNILNSGTFSKLELANLFGWFVVKDIWILIPNVLQSYGKMHAYDPEVIKTVASNRCYDLVLDLFPCTLDFLYVQNSSDMDIQDNIVLTNYLKSSFEDIVKNSHWLDETTRNSVLIRLSNMKNIIGYPHFLNNKTEFEKILGDFPLMNEVSLRHYFKILQYYIKLRILSLKVPSNYLEWVLPRPVSDVSAYYIVFKNTVVYPIALHNPPFYYFKGPWYLNFGAVGSVISHEMMHGIDNFGHEENNLNVELFNNISRMSYQNHAECFKYQYDMYDESGVCKNNGTYTLRENIADSEGLRIAFKAFKKHAMDIGYKQKYTVLNNYTPDQMFFIAFGSIWCSKMSPSMRKAMVNDSHSLPEVRVNKAVSNSESFALAFNCPKGSPMNPVKKCSIW